MAFGKQKAPAPVPVENPEVAYEVMSLRHVREHPKVAVLWQRTHSLAERLNALEEERRTIQAEIDVIEKSQAADIAEQGDQWQPPLSEA